MALVLIVWIILFCAAIVGLFLISGFFQLLRKKHFGEWERLGKPSLVANNSPQVSLTFLNYLRRSEYLRLNDREVISQAGRLWTFIRIYCVMFLATLGVLIAYIFKGES
jgi:hypothetical protein